MKHKILYCCLFLLVVLSFSVSVYSQDPQPEQNETEKKDKPKEVKPWYEGETVRAVLGYEQTGASSAQSSQFFFADFFFSHPFPIQFSKHRGYLGPRFRMWGNVRLTSVPQTVRSNITVSEFARNFTQEAGKLKLNEVAQAVGMLIGLEYRLLDLKSFSGNYSYSLGLIAGFGAITPLSPKESMEIFQVSQDLKDRYKTNFITGEDYDYTGKEYAALVNSRRNRFFRQYFAGIRFKTFLNPDKHGGRSQFPTILDITYGLNDSVTGGKLNEGVFRLDFFQPLKISSAVTIYLFGNMQLLASKTRTEAPLILAPAPDDATVTVPAGNVIIITPPPINSEYYRIGVGIDLTGVLASFRRD
ncbi:MAG: hypothetical protein KAW12_20195 [Candidatus Aminicenantes bacterium]|nr:hypothetical protein [Candidatus Aminicenantes bacterium]